MLWVSGDRCTLRGGVDIYGLAAGTWKVRLDLWIEFLILTITITILTAATSQGARHSPKIKRKNMNKAVYIAPEDQDEVDLGWMREALVMVSAGCGEGVPRKAGGRATVSIRTAAIVCNALGKLHGS